MKIPSTIKIASRRDFLVTCAAFGCLYSGAHAWHNKHLAQKKTPSNPAFNEITSSLCSNKNTIGIGLSGNYFEQHNFEGKEIITRIDKYINSNLLQSTDKAKSIRWSGWVKASLPGPHRFHFDHPGARIFVSKKNFSLDRENSTESIDLVVGNFYAISLEVFKLEEDKRQSFKLEWTPPHGYRYPISSAMLFPPMG